jgi:ABC-type multidrug transport system permease subunit
LDGGLFPGNADPTTAPVQVDQRLVCVSVPLSHRFWLRHGKGGHHPRAQLPGVSASWAGGHVQHDPGLFIGSEINIARFYWHILEEFQTAPISNAGYVLGEVLAGITRALLAGCVILILGALFGVALSYNGYLWLAFLLNSFIFASLAVGFAMLVKSHADQAMVNSFVITPMAFLGGTFFPIENLPNWAQKMLYFIPLTHAADAIRASSFGKAPEIRDYLILAGIAVSAFIFAIVTVNKARD